MSDYELSFPPYSSVRWNSIGQVVHGNSVINNNQSTARSSFFFFKRERERKNRRKDLYAKSGTMSNSEPTEEANDVDPTRSF